MAGIKAPILDILTKLSTISVVNQDNQTVMLFARVWNNQLIYEKEGKLESYPKPAAFVEVLSPATYEVIGQGFRSADILFRIHIIHEYMNLDGTFEQDLVIFDLRDKVIANLMMWEPTACSPLTAISEEQDYEHDNLYHYIIDFVTNFTDSIGSRLDADNPNAYITSTPPATLELDVDVDDTGASDEQSKVLREFIINKTTI